MEKQGQTRTGTLWSQGQKAGAKRTGMLWGGQDQETGTCLVRASSVVGLARDVCLIGA
jgi:hypothetical protein